MNKCVKAPHVDKKHHHHHHDNLKNYALKHHTLDALLNVVTNSMLHQLKGCNYSYIYI